MISPEERLAMLEEANDYQRRETLRRARKRRELEPDQYLQALSSAAAFFEKAAAIRRPRTLPWASQGSFLL